ncbi:MAG: hypothetical protein WKH64_16145 [Chloroflexia bacterium]
MRGVAFGGGDGEPGPMGGLALRPRAVSGKEKGGVLSKSTTPYKTA